MKYRFFTVQVLDTGAACDELNAFCTGKRVVAIDKQFVADGSRSFWAFCVTYLDTPKQTQTSFRKNRIDYREVLNEKDFGVFAKLRVLRKELAEKENIPAYALFTNEQLADMVRSRVTTRSDLGSIDGVGKARLEKYGDKFLGILKRELTPATSAESMDS